MGLLLAFAPFIVFVIVERLAGPRMGLTAATLVSGGLLLRDRQSRNRAVKVLEIGTFLLFGGLAAYAMASGAAWSVVGVRPRVDAGLLLMVLVSIAIRRPFTLSYARRNATGNVEQSRIYQDELHHYRGLGVGLRGHGQRGPGHALPAESAAENRNWRDYFGDRGSDPLHVLVYRSYARQFNRLHPKI